MVPKKPLGPVGSQKPLEEQRELKKALSELSPEQPSTKQDDFPDLTAIKPDDRKEETPLMDRLDPARSTDGIQPRRPDMPRADVDPLLKEADADQLVKRALSDTAGQPVAERLIREVRIEDLSLAEQTELAVLCHERIGKAAGYIPDFASITENMKAAHLEAVKIVWLAAQRKARAYK
jgi:hypothetical protein